MSTSWKDVEHRAARAAAVFGGIFVLAGIVSVALLVLVGQQIAEAQAELQGVQHQLEVAGGELEDARSALAHTTQRLTAEEEKLEAKQAELREVEAILGRTREEARLEARLLEAVGESARQAASARVYSRIDASEIPVRVYLHVYGRQGVARAGDLTRVLESAGFVAMDIDDVSRTHDPPPTNQVRYYRDEDRPDAERVAAVLSKQGVDARLLDVSRYATRSVRPRTVEVWLRP